MKNRNAHVWKNWTILLATGLLLGGTVGCSTRRGRNERAEARGERRQEFRQAREDDREAVRQGYRPQQD